MIPLFFYLLNSRDPYQNTQTSCISINADQSKAQARTFQNYSDINHPQALPSAACLPPASNTARAAPTGRRRLRCCRLRWRRPTPLPKYSPLPISIERRPAAARSPARSMNTAGPPSWPAWQPSRGFRHPLRIQSRELPAGGMTFHCR
jgi:hypothetical protein